MSVATEIPLKKTSEFGLVNAEDPPRDKFTTGAAPKLLTKSGELRPGDVVFGACALICAAGGEV